MALLWLRAGVLVEVLAELVVGCPLLRIGQDAVGLSDQLEPFLGPFSVIRVFVRVMLESHFFVSLFDFILGRGLGDTENIVVAGHCSRSGGGANSALSENTKENSRNFKQRNSKKLFLTDRNEILE